MSCARYKSLDVSFVETSIVSCSFYFPWRGAGEFVRCSQDLGRDRIFRAAGRLARFRD